MIAFLGIILLYFSSNKIWPTKETLQIVAKDIGALLFVTTVVTILWELWAKRAFMDEVLTKVRMADEVKLAGILRVTDKFHTDIEWNDLFDSVRKLDLFFAYSHTWRYTHRAKIESAVSNKDVRIRIVLPDPENTQTLTELSSRFNCTEHELKENIEEAKNFFKNLHCEANMKIWFTQKVPLFSYYRFDKKAVFALYTHKRGQALVPTFVVEMGGTLYNYLREEFNDIIGPETPVKLIFDTEEK